MQTSIAPTRSRSSGAWGSRARARPRSRRTEARRPYARTRRATRTSGCERRGHDRAPLLPLGRGTPQIQRRGARTSRRRKRTGRRPLPRSPRCRAAPLGDPPEVRPAERARPVPRGHLQEVARGHAGEAVERARAPRRGRRARRWRPASPYRAPASIPALARSARGAEAGPRCAGSSAGRDTIAASRACSTAISSSRASVRCTDRTLRPSASRAPACATGPSFGHGNPSAAPWVRCKPIHHRAVAALERATLRRVLREVDARPTTSPLARRARADRARRPVRRVERVGRGGVGELRGGHAPTRRLGAPCSPATAHRVLAFTPNTSWKTHPADPRAREWCTATSEFVTSPTAAVADASSSATARVDRLALRPRR